MMQKQQNDMIETLSR